MEFPTGVIASLADSAFAMALIDLVDPEDRITTIEFKINFFVSVDKGELEPQAKIIHKGLKTASGDVEVVNEKEKSRFHGQRRIMSGRRDETCLFSSEARCTGAITRGSAI